MVTERVAFGVKLSIRKHWNQSATTNEKVKICDYKKHKILLFRQGRCAAVNLLQRQH